MGKTTEKAVETMVGWYKPSEYLPEVIGEKGTSVFAYLFGSFHSVLYHPDRGWYSYDINHDKIQQYTWQPDYWAYIPDLSDTPHSKGT